ncbi:MAG: hypothetical protein AB7O65_03145 [Candidatus Korobacteraceae bacterium]
MKKPPATRILAMDVRRTRLGYVVFEEPLLLLDWDTLRFSSSRECAQKVEMRIEQFRPYALIVRRPSAVTSHKPHHTRAVMAAVRQVASKLGIRVVSVSDYKTGTFFLNHGKKTRHERGTLIATWFPELEPKLPPPRKVWMPEDRRMLIFAAASLAITYLNERTDSSGNGYFFKGSKSSFDGLSAT